MTRMGDIAPVGVHRTCCRLVFTKPPIGWCSQNLLSCHSEQSEESVCSLMSMLGKNNRSLTAFGMTPQGRDDTHGRYRSGWCSQNLLSVGVHQTSHRLVFTEPPIVSFRAERGICLFFNFNAG